MRDNQKRILSQDFVTFDPDEEGKAKRNMVGGGGGQRADAWTVASRGSRARGRQGQTTPPKQTSPRVPFQVRAVASQQQILYYNVTTSFLQALTL